MSSITKRQFAIKARQYLTERDEAVAGFSVPMLMSLIDDALGDLGVDVARDPALRHLMRTDPASTTISVVGGVADLSTLIETDQVLLEFIRTAEIKGANDHPYQWVPSLAMLRLKRKTDNFFTFCAVEGTNLYTRNGGTLTDLSEDPTVSASRTDTLAQLRSELETSLVEKIAQRAMSTLGSQQQKIAASAIGKNAA